VPTARSFVPGDPPPYPTIDAYRSGDEAGIVACFRASFGADARLERWRYLHLANPAGPSVIVVARHEDEIVGQMASMRRRVRFFGGEHVIAHVLDTMVHPTWQRRGVFRALADAMERHVERMGLHVSYGVANDAAKHGAVRYELRRPLGTFPVLVRPLRPLASLMAMVRHRFRQRAEDAEGRVTECAASGPFAAPPGPTLAEAGDGDWTLPHFDARHTELFATAVDLPPIAFVRDAEALAWRYPSTIGGPYIQRDLARGDAIAATAIVRLVKAAGLRVALVMEWHWRGGDQAAGRALAQDVIALARRAGAHGIAAMGARSSAQRRILGSLGFLALPARAFPQHAWPSVHARAPHATDVRWYVGTNWYFTWGDGLTL
jgi:predicted N-acetyltransferase YhbS